MKDQHDSLYSAKLLNESTECPNHKYYWGCYVLDIPFDEVFVFE